MSLAGTLEIQLLADIARIKSDMDQAKSVVTGTMDRIESAATFATRALGALGIGLSVNMFARMIQGSIDAQDELLKMSQRVGVSVESLAGLDHAASLSGTSLTTVEKALKTVSTQLIDADRGLKTAKDNFALLGVSIYDTNGQLKESDQVMIEVADRFVEMEDGTAKTAAATKLFGRAGLELIPMLNLGSAGLAELIAEGQRYNPVTAESAAQAEIFNDNMDRLKQSVSLFGRTIANEAIPWLSGMSEKMVNLSTDAITGAGNIRDFIGHLLQTDEAKTVMENLVRVLEALGIVITTRVVISTAALAASLVATAIATTTAHTGFVAFEATLLLATIATRAMSIAMAGLNTAMAFLGGPLGLALLATYGIYEFVSAQREAAGDTRTFTEALEDNAVGIQASSDAMTNAYLAGIGFAGSTQQVNAAVEVMTHRTQGFVGPMQQMTYLTQGFVGPLQQVSSGVNRLTGEISEHEQKALDLIDTLQNQLVAYGLTEREAHLFNETLKLGTDVSEESRAEYIFLVEKLYDLELANEAAANKTKKLAEAQEIVNAKIRESEEEINKQNTAADEMVASMGEQIRMLGMTDRDLAIYRANMSLGKNVTDEKRAAVTALAAKYYDLENSLKATIDPLEVQREMFEGIQESLGDVLYGMLDEGKFKFKDFFDSVLDMFKRMVAEMLAADLMNAIFGGRGLSALTGGNLASGISSILGLFGGGSNTGSNVLSSTISSVGSAAASIMGAGGGATAMNAVGPLAAGYAAPAAGGGIMSSLGGTLSGIGATVWGGLKAIGSGAMNLISAIPGWGWVIGGLAAAAALLDKESTPSHNAGFLTSVPPSLVGSPDVFEAARFASGVDVYGWTRRQPQEKAIEVISAFGTVDQLLTQILRDAGYNVDLRGADFPGYNEKGLSYRGGVFWGSAGEEGQPGTALEEQLNNYARRFVEVVALKNGLSSSLVNEVLAGANTVEDIILRVSQAVTASQQPTLPPLQTESQPFRLADLPPLQTESQPYRAPDQIDGSHRSGLEFVPRDAYQAELHYGEKVSSRAQVQASDTMMRELRDEVRRMTMYVKKTSDILLRVTRDGDALLVENA